MLWIFIHRVVHFVIDLIEQTQGTNLSSVPQTTYLALRQPFRTANNTIKQTQSSYPLFEVSLLVNDYADELT